MALDPSVIAAIAGTFGVLGAKGLDVALERFRAKSSARVTAHSVLNDQSSLLFNQLGQQVNELRRDLRETQKREEEYRLENAELKEQVTDLKADVRRLPRMETEIKNLRRENNKLHDEVRQLREFCYAHGFKDDVLPRSFNEDTERLGG